MTLNELCAQVLARQSLIVVVDPRRPDCERPALNRELERLRDVIGQSNRAIDAVGDLARQLAAVALTSLDVRSPGTDGAGLAQLVLEYPSMAPWWPDPEAGPIDYDDTVNEWRIEVGRLIAKVLASDQPPAFAGEPMRTSALKALARLCLEFAAWTETGPGDLAALAAAAID